MEKSFTWSEALIFHRKSWFIASRCQEVRKIIVPCIHDSSHQFFDISPLLFIQVATHQICYQQMNAHICKLSRAENTGPIIYLSLECVTVPDLLDLSSLTRLPSSIGLWHPPLNLLHWHSTWEWLPPFIMAKTCWYISARLCHTLFRWIFLRLELLK